MGVTVPPCPEGKAILNTSWCTMGRSLAPLFHDPTAGVNQASFSQYPRGKWHSSSAGTPPEGSSPSPSICLHDACVMGYTLVTRLAGQEYRYTEWVQFNGQVPGGPSWAPEHLVGTELYAMSAQGTWPDRNSAHDPAYSAVVQTLAALLHKGPTTAGGWGPASAEAPSV